MLIKLNMLIAHQSSYSTEWSECIHTQVLTVTSSGIGIRSAMSCSDQEYDIKHPAETHKINEAAIWKASSVFRTPSAMCHCLSLALLRSALHRSAVSSAECWLDSHKPLAVSRPGHVTRLRRWGRWEGRAISYGAWRVWPDTWATPECCII